MRSAGRAARPEEVGKQSPCSLLKESRHFEISANITMKKSRFPHFWSPTGWPFIAIVAQSQLLEKVQFDTIFYVKIGYIKFDMRFIG